MIEHTQAQTARRAGQVGNDRKKEVKSYEKDECLRLVHG